MKLRLFALVVLAVCLGGGLMWWLRQSKEWEPAPVKSQVGSARLSLAPRMASGPASSGVVIPPKSARALANSLPSAAVNNDEARPLTPGIHIGDEPPNGTAIVLNRIKQQPGVFRMGPGGQTPYDADTLVVKPGYAIYEFRDLNEVARGGGLDAAQNFAFGYIVESPDEIVGAAEVRIDEDANTRIMSIGRISPALYFIQVLQQVEALDRVRSGSFEVRLLRESGGLGLQAIWLKADTGGADLIVPLGKGNGRFAAVAGLEAGKLYTESEFLALFQPYAQQMLEQAAAQRALDVSRPADGSGSIYDLKGG